MRKARDGSKSFVDYRYPLQATETRKEFCKCTI